MEVVLAALVVVPLVAAPLVVVPSATLLAHPLEVNLLASRRASSHSLPAGSFDLVASIEPRKTTIAIAFESQPFHRFPYPMGPLDSYPRL